MQNSRISIQPVAVAALVVLFGASAAAQTAPAAGNWNAGAWKEREAQMSRREAKFQVSAREVGVRFLSEMEHQDWARGLLADMGKLLQAIAELTGVPYPGPDQLQIVEDAGLPSFQWYGDDSGIHLRYGATAGDLAHGLAHIWFGGKATNVGWLHQGYGEWVAIEALRRSGHGYEAQLRWEKLRQAFVAGFGSNDYPLNDRDISAAVPQAYEFALGKAAALVYTMRATLGEQSMFAFNARLVTAPASLDFEGVKAAFNAAYGSRPPEVFPGWAEAGAYTQYRVDQFNDSDNDMLDDMLEAVAGTHPKSEDGDGDGLTDGYEYWHGLNPGSRDSDGDSKPDLQTVSVAVDGLAADWESREVLPIFEDAVRDGQGADFEKISVGADPENLYVAIGFQGPVPLDSDHEILIQLSWGGQTPDLGVGFACDGSSRWVVKYKKGSAPASVSLDSLQTHVNNIAEAAIPLSLLGGKKAVKVNVQIWSKKANEPVDHMGGWWQPFKLSEHLVQ